MFERLKKNSMKQRAEPQRERSEESYSAAKSQQRKPGQSTEFKSKVLKAKLEVIEAIKNADKQRAMDAMMAMSTLAAQAIYEHDLRAMLIINTAIDEINHQIDAKMMSTSEPEDLIEDMEETRMYLMISLTILPVRSMMDALQKFSSTGMDEVNSDLNSRINQIQQFIMEHEKGR